MEFDLQPVGQSSQVQPQTSSGQAQSQPKFDLQPIQAPQSQPEQVPTQSVGQQVSDVTKNAIPAVFNPQVAGAAVAGLGNFGASTGESVADAGIWAANHLGMSDETANKLKGAVKQGADEFRTTPDANGDFFQQSMAAQPFVAAVAQYAPAVVALGKLSPGDVIDGGGVAGAVTNTGVRAGVNALVSAGIASNDKESQDTAALYSAALTPAVEVGAALINKGAVALNLPNKVREILEPIYTRIKNAAGVTVKDAAVQSEAAKTTATILQNDANYKTIKELPGMIQASPIRSAARQLMEDTGSTIEQDGTKMMWNHSGSSLSDKQIKVLQGIQQDAGRVKDMESAVILRQQISANRSLFQGQGVNKIAFDSYQKMLSDIDSQIGNIASQNGKADAFLHANKFNQFAVQPLYESGAVDRAAAVTQRQGQQAFNASQAPGAIQASESPAYTLATQQIFKPNMTPQQVREQLSRMTGDGKQAMEDHFVSQSFKDIMANPQTFDKNDALMKLNRLTTTYKDVLSKQSLDTFRGMQVMLKEAGAVAKKSGQSTTYLEHYAGRAIGGALGGAVGGYEGYEQGGGKGALIGGIAGIGAGATAMNVFKSGLADTALGQGILRHFITNPEAARQLLTSGTRSYVGKITESE